MKTRVLSLLSLFVIVALLAPVGTPSIAAEAISAPPLPLADGVNDYAVDAPSVEARVDETMRNSPVMFIENVGQFDTGARFQVRGGNGTLWLADDALWITIVEPSAVSDQRSARFAHTPESPFNRYPESEIENRQVVNLRLSFPNANPNPRLEPFDRLDTVVSYFIGNDPAQWRTAVPVWGGVRYVDLYPGIDLEVTSEGGQFVQRLHAQPGADLSQVQLRVEGAEAVELAGTEGLRLSTTVGDYILPLLTVADTTPEAPPALSTAGTRTFDILTPFTLSLPHPLTPSSAIQNQDNPTHLLYSTFLGGSSADYGYGIAVDDAGNAYVTGFTYSTDFPATGGPDLTHNGSQDALVAKVNAAGTGIVYAGFLGGSGGDVGNGIAVDGAGNAYITGHTGSTDFPAIGGPDLTYNGGEQDAFVAKVNAAGTALVYAGFLGGSGNGSGSGIAVDGAGNAYVTGDTWSTDFPVTGGPDLTYNGGWDVFVAKVNAAGTSLVYAGFLGGSSDDYGNGIAVDDAGNAYVTGYTGSTDFPATGGPDLTYNGGDYDAFVAKVNAAGTALVYAGFLGGSGNGSGSGIAVDGAGNAYVTGDTWSTDFPVTGGPDLTYNGGRDAFVAKVNAAGIALVYAGFLGGSSDDHGSGIAVDDAGNAYITGRTGSTDFPAIGGPDLTHNGGDWDAFVTKVNAAGTGLVYAGFLGGSNWDWGSGTAVDGVGNAYITGRTESTDFPATGGPDLTHNGGSDAFVAKVSGEGGVSQLELTGLEVTQGIQNQLNEDVVLIQDRPTFVRAHVRSISGTVDGVTAELVGRRDGSELPGSPLRPANRGGTIRVLENPDRLQLNDSFYFELPESWRNGTVEFEFRGDSHTIACKESVGTDNDCKAQVIFSPSPKLEVRIVSIVWRGELGWPTHRPSDRQVEEVIQQVRSTFPTYELDITRGEWVIPWDGRPQYNADGYDDFDRIINQLVIMRRMDGCITALPTSCRRYYLGILADPPISGVMGMAGGIPADVAVAYITDNRTPAHELGHAAGRYHTDYNAQRGIDPPEGGPQYHEPVDGTISQEKSGDNAFYGFDINTKQVHGPSTADLMSYGRPRWPSNWTYTHIRDHLVSRYGTSVFSLALLTGEPAVLVSGVVTPTEATGSLDAVYGVESPVSVSAPDPGTYTIWFEDDAGQELASYSFEPDFGVVDYAGYTDDNASGVGTFALFLPWNASTARIVLLHDTQQLDSRTASNTAPIVNVTYPNGGELLAGSTVTLTWSANDLDGDPLEYVVQYSVDAGMSWQTLASVWPSTTYALNLDIIAGTDQGVVRILASDGFHTSQDQSDGTFVVAKHPPQVNIQAPQNNSLYVGEQTLILEGGAFDNEDGQLAGTELSWTSNLDGVLGTGHSLAIVASILAEGTHTVTLTAQDSDGLTNTASIALQIYRERPTLPSTLAVAPDALSFVAVKDGGQTVSQTVSIRNDGDGTMNWSATADQSWILASALEGVTSADIIVAADPTGLSVGGYTGNITITAAGAVNSPQTIEIALYIRPKLYVYLPMVLR